MSFPFSIKYSATLVEKVNPPDYPIVLQFISDFIISKPAKDIVIEDNSLSFKAGSAWSNWNIMQTIDRGVFCLEEKEGDVILTYEFFMYKLFIYTSLMALAMGIVSQEIWAGVGAFLWLCGMNWVIGVVRHRGLLDELAADIDSFINEKKAGGSVHPKG